MVEQQKISERLLLNVLPHTIAEQLKVRSTGSTVFSEVIAESFSEATVLFADIVEFTKVSARLSPRQLVVPLNEVFTSFDRIADNRGLEKIKTNGDSYMAVAGVPVSVSDHAARAAHAALDMLSAVDYFNMRTGNNLQVRIGLNSGPSVAGVIGQSKFIYDVWGEAVNVASQMESHGVAGRVQVTESTMRQLGEHFLFEPRGTIELKGRGPVDTWFLVGRRHNNSVRPTTLSG
jgi:class 3 adenylate cyclase